MSRSWTGDGWAIECSTSLSVTGPDGVLAVAADEADRFDVRRRWFRWGLYRDGERVVSLPGLSRSDARSLRAAVRSLAVRGELAGALAWSERLDAVLSGALTARRWITSETTALLAADRPDPGLAERITAAGATADLSDREQWALATVATDVRAAVAAANRRILADELTERRHFFDTIERSPLTDEQATAVVCFDSRVQLLAAAGSGKTSVMVARAAYAVDRGFVAPERILLLAFNRNAAKELQERIDARFTAAGIDASGVRAATFHSFGLDVIGAATGRKPRLAPWLDGDNGIGEVLRIVDHLGTTSPAFRRDWDLYRLLFANAPTELDDGEPDGWDRESSTAGYRTFGGEVVKSHGERLIADFLHLNGVAYRYEQPYAFDVADADHSQYRPDFYYPDLDVWHEHWALDRDGKPPEEFGGYLESMLWKRQLHAERRTRLIETTWADVVFGDGLEQLRLQLESHGAELRWNPDRAVDRWARPMDASAMARLVRTFMAHVKSNSLTPDAVEQRLAVTPGRDGFRTRLFLRIYWQIHDEWQRRLAADGSVDFEDMLVCAAEHLERGEVDTGHELVLVDELQDASRARARLVRALVARPGRHLLAVGDDWQAINRFAGSDLSVMTGFQEWFGPTTQLALTTTFRCPQSICDVASEFVSANPVQFTKPMRSARPGVGAPVMVVLDDDPARAVRTLLARISAAVAAGEEPVGTDGTVTVDVLGRYGFQRDLLPRAPKHLTVRFRTAHGSKGLEADHVVVVGLETGTYGFPSTIADDPVLDLAMPAAEGYPHAEERRLLYVALTRARRSVTLVAPPTRVSPFVVELLDHPDVVTRTAGGTERERVTVCPACGAGTMTPRTGPYSTFLGCTRFPACRHTQRLPAEVART